MDLHGFIRIFFLIFFYLIKKKLKGEPIANRHVLVEARKQCKKQVNVGLYITTLGTRFLKISGTH